MTLQERLAALAVAVGADVKALYERVANGVGTAGLNFRARTLPGLRVQTRAVMVASRQALGVLVSQAPAFLRTRYSMGLAITQRVSGTAKAPIKVGVAVSNRSAGTAARAASAAGMKMLMTLVSLVRDVGAATVTQEAVGGRSDWATITNAQGKRNGTNATFAGNALGARGGQLVFAYPASASAKSAMTITKVELRFYASQAGTTLNNGTLKLGYRLGAAGSEVQLEAFTANVDLLTAPRVYDLTAVVAGSWATLDAIKAYVNTNTALANTSTANCDAVELHVEATKNENQP